MHQVDKYCKVFTSTKGKEITSAGVVSESGDTIKGGSIVLALGMRPLSDVVEELQDTAPFVRVIGDALKVSTITNAVYCGYHAALDI